MLGKNGAGVNFDKSLDYADEGGEKCVSHAKRVRGMKGPVAIGEGSVGDPIAGSRFIGGGFYGGREFLGWYLGTCAMDLVM